MGIEYRGVVVVGYDYDEAFAIAQKIGVENLDELDFDIFQPAYDAPAEYSIYGVRLAKSGTYDYAEIDLKALDIKAYTIINEYEETYGIRPRVWLMSQGY